MKNIFIALATLTVAATSAWAANTADSRAIEIAGTHFAGGALASVDVSLEPIYCATGTLYAAFADADMGDSLADWPNVLVAAQTVTESDTLINYALPASWGSAGYKILRFFLVSSILRDGDYAARLEYVDFSASSGINTGVKTTEKSRVESRFMRITDDVQMSLYGSGGQTLTAWMGSNSGLTWRFNTKGVTPNVQTKNLWHDFVHSTNGVVTIRDGYAPVTNLYQAVSSFTSSANLYVFANGTDSSWTKTVRFAYLRHYTNDVLATSLVPCKLSDNTVAIFNTVSGAVVSSSGLTGGPEMVFASAFTNATATTVEYEERGASELDPSIAVDTSNQRTIGFSGRLSTIGAEPTFILLQYGGATKAMAEVEVDGTWSLVWDASADVAWTSADIPYAVVCSNSLNDTVWTSQVAGTFALVDNMAYTWTGAGETANWSDIGNWSHAIGDCVGAPIFGGDAVFTDGTDANIVLDVDARLWNYAVCASNVRVSLSAEAAHSLVVTNSFIVSNPNDATVCGSTFVFDGPITLNARFVSTGKGNTVRFENGVVYNASLVFQMAIQNSVDPYEGRLEILSGSSVNVEYLYINGNAVIVVDNAEIYVANCIVNCWAPGGTVNLAGSSPTFRTSNIRSGSGVANCTGRILFSIPVGGYSTPSQFSNIPAPFGYTSIGNTFGGNEPILWEIDHDSPAFGGSSSGETILCYSRSTSDIDTVHNEFVVPKWLSECNYTIDNEASPKIVSVSWTVRHGLTIFVR